MEAFPWDEAPHYLIRDHASSRADCAPVSRPVQRTGVINSYAILGGLHHHYVRVQVFGTHKGATGNI
jgi:hypothetical protein